jgi:Ca-activated chloride channel family protein
VIKNISRTPSRRYRHILFFFRLVVISLLILGFARPQSGTKEEKIITEGIDIILAMDISSSMRAEDLAQHRNRLDVTKEVATQFIKERSNDRIGMVVFSGKSFTQCPLTLDYGIVLNFLKEIQIGMIEDGTAIGMAIANCVNRLRASKAKSKVVILLTDGRNNRGELDPLTAAQIAKTMNVRIYTIGAGKRGEALYPIDDPFLGKRYVPMRVDIDDEVLTKIANITGGKYFRATDKKSLEKIYQEIGELEKTKIEVKEFTRYEELFINFLALAFGVLMLEIILANTRFRRIP